MDQALEPVEIIDAEVIHDVADDGALVLAGADPLDRYIPIWLRLFRSPHTRAAYTRDITAWRTWCHEAPDGRTMLDADAILFHQWRSSLGKSGEKNGKPRKAYSETTRARMESAVTSFYDSLIELRVLTDTPAHKKGAKHRTRPGGPDRPTPGLTLEQGRALLDAAHNRSQRDYLVVATLYSTGIRVSELTGGDIEDEGDDAVPGAHVEDLMHRDGTTVLKVIRKRGKVGYVEPDAETAEALWSWVAGRSPEGQLIPGDANGRRMTRDMASAIVEACGKAIGLDWVTPHVLRTSAINRLLEMGAPPDDIQAFAGHASITTTSAYFRRAEEAAKRAKMAEMMGRAMRGDES